MQVDKERGVCCNTVEIWESGRGDIQRDVSGRPRGGAGFQLEEAIDLRATHTPHRCAFLREGRHLMLKQTVFFRDCECHA